MKTALLTFVLSVFFISSNPAFSSVTSASVNVTNKTTVEPVAKNEQKQSFKNIRKAAEKSWVEN